MKDKKQTYIDTDDLKTAIALWVGFILFFSVFWGCIIIGGDSISILATFSLIISVALLALTIGVGKEFIFYGSGFKRIFKIFLIVLVTLALLFGGTRLFVFCLGDFLAPPEEYPSNSSSSFTNKYGTKHTTCATYGCTNKIASSGDTNCCPSHSNKCLNCNCYIDSDAIYCMDCIYGSISP